MLVKPFEAEQGVYSFKLEGIGVEIWQMLKNDYSYEGIKETICQNYQVSEEVAVADLKAFLAELKHNQLIQ